jgi:tetratricopeptide (TPR) repeat protein
MVLSAKQKILLWVLMVAAMVFLYFIIAPKYYFHKGNEYQKNGQYDKAIDAYNKAIILNPKGDKIYVERGVTCGRQMRPFDMCISDFNRAIELNPKNFMAYYDLGLAKMMSKQQGAVEDFNKAIELDPQYEAPYWALGSIYEYNGMKKEALVAYSNFIKYAPPNRASDVKIAKEKVKKLSEESNVFSKDATRVLQKGEEIIKQGLYINSDKYPNFNKYGKLRSQEKDIDYLRANQERYDLIDILLHSLSKDDLTYLATLSQTIHTSKTPLDKARNELTLYNFLFKHCQSEKYPDLYKVKQYTQEYVTIDFNQLAVEIQNYLLEEKV